MDFILTERGRELYATGQLEFAYFSLTDDGLDYDPYGATDDTREAAVTSPPMWEAPVVRDVRDSSAPLEPTCHLFAASPGYGTVPFMSSPATGSQVDLMCDQTVVDGSYRRSGSSIAQIDLLVSGEAESVNPGFQVRVFASGSTGLTELFARRDLSGRRSFDPFLALVIDDEIGPDGVRPDDPSSARRDSRALGPDVKKGSR